MNSLLKNNFNFSRTKNMITKEIKKYQWDIQGKGKSTITDKLRRTARTGQEQHRHNIKN